MLPKLRTSDQDMDELKDVPKIINYHEEYHKAIRTKPYADIYNKAQLLTKKLPSINYLNLNTFSRILLEPGQETIPSIIDTSLLSKNPKLKNLMLGYFETSAEASFICSNLLKSIYKVQSNHKFIQRALHIMDDDYDEDYTLDKFDLIIFQLDSFMSSNNPFSNLENNDFNLISDEHSSLLQHLKSMRKRVARKVTIMKYLKKTSTIVCFPCNLRNGIVGEVCVEKVSKFSKKSESQRDEIAESETRSSVCFDQLLDIAAKGSYIVNKDFDTMSSLVARLHDEIEHNKAIVQFFLERKDEKFSLEIVMEVIKKSDGGFRKQVEELEEHVYLCLLTINKARGLVIEEITKTFM